MSEPQAPPPPPSGPPPSQPPPPRAAPSTNVPMIVLAYLWILALIPFLVEKDDAEIQWHAKHGLVLLAVEIVLWIVVNIAMAGLGCFVLPLYFLLFLAVVVIRVTCIVKGINGQRFLIPGISQYAERF